MRPTQRIFKDVETGKSFRLYSDETQSKYDLISESVEDHQNRSFELKSDNYAKSPERFYICAHSGVTVKVNGSKEVFLSQGTFYNIKEGEEITHKKYVGFDKFTKVN